MYLYIVHFLSLFVTFLQRSAFRCFIFVCLDIHVILHIMIPPVHKDDRIVVMQTQYAPIYAFNPRSSRNYIRWRAVSPPVFVLCYSPFFIFNLLDVFNRIQHTDTTRAVRIFIQSLAPLNSVANPLIYGLFSSRVCRNLRSAYGSTVTVAHKYNSPLLCTLLLCRVVFFFSAISCSAM